MNIKTDFPHPIRTIPHIWIPIPDGTRLAARIWLPQDAEQQPVPAILEYIPYRKNDGTAQRDAIRHPYIAGHGYACVRVDMRGSGDSDGILYDEYLLQEQDDGLAVLTWIAAQPWCTGGVGIIGKSWGGFNGLQIAVRRPPELKAIITVCSTDDRYADDVHYMGGCVLASDMLSWASTMFAYNARPPDPRVVGERWRAMWRERLEKTPPYIEEWLRHQTRDAFWQHGSVCENYAAIECAVYAVGGWNDGYSNAVFRLLEGLSCPRKGLIGPWSHQYPESAEYPGPAMGFNQECLRWWDTWLKGEETGMMTEPALRVWMQESVAADTARAHWPGRWVAESGWPVSGPQPTRLFLTGAGLHSQPDSGASRSIRGVQYHGLHAGNWCPFGLPGELPGDQRVEDGLALCFTSAPVADAVEILGFPEVTLTLAADQPTALVAVRLCDVAPSGTSTLVSRGLLNLTHRNGHETPEPLEPGQFYTVTIRLNAIAHSLPAGHCWRIAISPTYWPHAWPSPDVVTLKVALDDTTCLTLPTRLPRAADEALQPFAAPEISPPLAVEVLRPATVKRTISHDVITGTHELTLSTDNGRIRYPGSSHDKLANSHIYEDKYTVIYTISEDDLRAAQVRCTWTLGLDYGEHRTHIATVSTMTADATRFHVSNQLDAYEGQTRVFTSSLASKTRRCHT